ncbi:hypothetical protein, partial [Nitrosomonas europaea]|uniref:hypothetical protein n=1 Tax=Nitrosomonas europaea TaxID=915 RepID=UPI0023F393D2
LKRSGALGTFAALDWMLPIYARSDSLSVVTPTTQLSGDVINLTIARLRSASTTTLQLPQPSMVRFQDLCFICAKGRTLP